MNSYFKEEKELLSSVLKMIVLEEIGHKISLKEIDWISRN